MLSFLINSTTYIFLIIFKVLEAAISENSHEIICDEDSFAVDYGSVLN